MILRHELAGALHSLAEDAVLLFLFTKEAAQTHQAFFFLSLFNFSSMLNSRSSANPKENIRHRELTPTADTNRIDAMRPQSLLAYQVIADCLP